jgi:hypothetical protein
MNGYLYLEPPFGDGLVTDWEELYAPLALARKYGFSERPIEYDHGEEDDIEVYGAKQAARLGEALARALDDIPDHDISLPKLVVCPLGALEFYLDEDPLDPLTPLERFSGESKSIVRELVEVCRRGRLRVEREWL